MKNLIKEIDYLTNCSLEEYNQFFKKLKYIEDQRFDNKLCDTHYYIRTKEEKPILPQYRLKEVNIMAWD